MAEENLDFSVLFSIWKHLNTSAISITCFSLAILLCWEKLLPRASKVVPSAVVVVLAAAILNMLLKKLDPTLALGSSYLVKIPINQTMSEFFMQFKHPNFSGLTNINVYIYALMIAAIAFINIKSKST